MHGAGAQVIRELPSVAGEAVAVPKGTASAFWRQVGGAGGRTLATGVTRVWLDGRVTATLDHSVPQIGAPTAWQAGHTGQGAKVAVLDTGVDTTHPDLADAVSTAQDFTRSQSGTADKFGHGTHVAGIITGSGTASGGKYRGVAPDATILNGKVLNDFGSGLDSWILAGMEWAVAQGADVVNMSLGSDFPSDGTDPMSLAVNRLTADSGALFVVSAGNSGPSDMTVGSPGAADAALTVGAVDGQDQLAEFSSRGPRWSDSAVKPDITAPGVDIVAPLAEGSYLGGREPVVDGRYLKLSGTSMAAPHVAGAAAILAAQRPEWTAERLKPALMGSAAPRPDLTVYQQGAGRVDVARAVAQQVTATPASVSLGVQQWPHADDKPTTSTLTYRNAGSAPVTLDVAVEGRDPSGNAAPAGMFTVDTPRLTVPAGGTASVNLVTDTAVPAPDGRYSAVVTATDGQVNVRTPVGVIREVESYDVTLTFLDRAAQQTPDYSFRLVNTAREETVSAYDGSGKVVARVPKGTYYFEATVGTPDDASPFGFNESIIVEPEFTVTADANHVFDAREAKSPSFTLDQPNAKPADGLIGFWRDTDWSEFGTGGVLSFTGNVDYLFIRPSSTASPPGEFRYSEEFHLAEPDGAGGFLDSPYLYHLRHQVDRRVPADLAPRVRDGDLAATDTRIASSAPNQFVMKEVSMVVRTPATIREYYTPGEWRPMIFVLKPGSDLIADSVIGSEPVIYQRTAKPTVERWNVAVFGPAFPGGPSWATRSGDTLSFFVPPFADQAANHHGWSYVDPVQLTLDRDGQRVGEWSGDSGRYTAPAGSATYRLAANATRTSSTLSTRISAVWTFRSGQTDSYQALPVMAVRFAPTLDGYNSAKAGMPFAFPVYVQRQNDASYGSLTDLTVRASYDDGATWEPVMLTGDGLQRTAVLRHRAGAGFVSLQATAVDSNGNKVEQTIIRAYALQA